MSTEASGFTENPTPALKGAVPDAPPAEAGQPAGGDAARTRGGRVPRRLVLPFVCLLVLSAISILTWRLMVNRAEARRLAELRLQPRVVAVCPVARRTLFNQFPVVAEFRPYQEVELHAKVSGYICSIPFDFGDLVKSNQVLATLEVPELQDQLRNAIAVEQKAEADYRATHTNYMRLLTVGTQHPDLVAQQDLDTAQGKDGMAEAAVAAAKADVARYLTLSSYTNVVAPFDGVITHRYVDKGTLIQMGTSSDTQALPVFRVSENYLLRLDFWVSVEYVKDIRLGDTVEVRVESLGMKTFKGTIKRFSDRVDLATREMRTEIEVPNPTLEIVPGMYADVMLKVHERQNTLSIPTQAVSGEKPTVYVVNANREIEERAVTLGLETPNRREVLSGLHEGDLVMLGSRAQVQPGQKVTPKLTAPETFADE